jgi:2,3-bisphosphoglycerate-dependent phosphoglycerate mutase
MPHIVQATVVGMKEILELNVVFLRHGETDANKYKICQGQSDYPLNSNGINAATKTGETFQNREWSLVYSSDLSRAYDVRI